MKFKMLLGIALCAAVAAGCSNKKQAKVPAINPDNLNTEVAPGEDFYEYATGGWQRNNPLRPEFARYGSFDILSEDNEIRLNELFQGLLSRKTKEGSVEQKIADLYTMGLDSARLNSEGARPVLAYLRQLDEVTDLESFAVASAYFRMYGMGSIYSTSVGADLMDSDVNVLYLGSSGLSLRNRDYYLLPQHEALRQGYKAFIEKIFTLAGYENAAEIASDAFDVEMALAVPTWSMERSRDVAAQYNPASSKEVIAAYPNLRLGTYFSTLGIPDQDKIVVEQPDYMAAIDKLVPGMGADKLRHYLQSKLLQQACGLISDDFTEASFDFFSRQMSGIQEQKPRWKRAMSLPNGILGEAVGKMFVEKYFPEENKAKMLAIVKNIQTALSKHISELEWMSEETKAKAQEKLNSFTVKIGYPDKWKDYSSLSISKDLSYFDNSLAAMRWHTKDNFDDLGKPVDRDEWGMTPQTVNAYYNPTTNEICFPAGILQPPFFFADADDAVNYGAIGVVISHEMTHGFDDQGRLFDKDGNMVNWWTEADSEAFKAKTGKLVEQFNQVEVLPGVFANGAATLGENIADQGGLRIAYTALQTALGGSRPEPIDGFTPEQRFYLAYANVWAQNITDAEIQRRTLLDVHSIGENRVNVSVRNLDTFFEAFGIKEGDAMFRPVEDRVVIW